METFFITQRSKYWNEVHYIYFDNIFDILSGLEIVLLDWRRSLLANAQNFVEKYNSITLIPASISYLVWNWVYSIGDIPYHPNLDIWKRSNFLYFHTSSDIPSSLKLGLFVWWHSLSTKPQAFEAIYISLILNTVLIFYLVWSFFIRLVTFLITQTTNFEAKYIYLFYYIEDLIIYPLCSRHFSHENNVNNSDSCRSLGQIRCECIYLK